MPFGAASRALRATEQAFRSGRLGSRGSARSQRNAKYKTEMCHNLHKKEGCKYGSGCHYAHSGAELRTFTIAMMISHGRLSEAKVGATESAPRRRAAARAPDARLPRPPVPRAADR